MSEMIVRPHTQRRVVKFAVLTSLGLSAVIWPQQAFACQCINYKKSLPAQERYEKLRGRYQYLAKGCVKSVTKANPFDFSGWAKFSLTLKVRDGITGSIGKDIKVDVSGCGEETMPMAKLLQEAKKKSQLVTLLLGKLPESKDYHTGSCAYYEFAAVSSELNAQEGELKCSK